MRGDETIILKRDCEAIQIPSGTPITLRAGTEVSITQALGGSYTVMTDYGILVRVDGTDADALGKETENGSASAASNGGKDLEQLVWDQLRTCFDPEIPVNIADLGLIYSCVISPAPEGGNHVEIKMTLTAPGCGMGDFLKQDVQMKIARLPGVSGVDVEVVFDPPWNQSMMSEAAKLELGML